MKLELKLIVNFISSLPSHPPSFLTVVLFSPRIPQFHPPAPLVFSSSSHHFILLPLIQTTSAHIQSRFSPLFFYSFLFFPVIFLQFYCLLLLSAVSRKSFYIEHNFFFSSALWTFQHAISNWALPLFVPLFSSTAHWRSPEGRAAWRSSDQSAIQLQTAILHRNGPAPPSTSLSIKVSAYRDKREKGDENDSIFKRIMR